MKKIIVLLAILSFGACKCQHNHSDIPSEKRMPKAEPVVSEKQEPSDGFLQYSIVIYTYDLKKVVSLDRVVDSLNAAFFSAKISFKYKTTKLQQFPDIESLEKRDYKSYYELTTELDIENTLCIWLVPSGDMCDRNSCSATKGFSNINETPGNIVVTEFGWLNTAVVVHEMGHWFGLNHTTDDEIEDTPYDPGSLYSVYISYDDCEMFHPDGHKPMIENFMSYYEHCPKKKKTFTPMQYDRMREVAWGSKFSYAVVQ